MVINWGKPTLEFAAYTGSSFDAESASWTAFPTPVENTTQLETTAGDKVEAKEEGGGTVDTYQKKSKYAFSFELFVKKGQDKPIEDNDGVISANYAFRLTPEDPTCHGYLVEKASVSILETFNSQDGSRWKYTFDALVPDSGKKMLQKYVKGS